MNVPVRNDIKITLVNPEDSRVFAIESEVVKSSPDVYDTGSQAAFVALLRGRRADRSMVALAWAGREAVAYIALVYRDKSDELEVLSVAVRPNWQHRGIGTFLMSWAETQARELGKQNLTLVTNPKNVHAVHLYKKQGYSIENEVENYYGDGNPRTLFRKQL